jgi:hypothetical protein
MSFSRYNTEDSVISAETVVRGLWTGDTGSLSTFFTSSTGLAASGEYYVDVYNSNPSVSTAENQFDIQYGHIYGSGSVPVNSNVRGYSPSRIVYGQYRNLVYGTEDTNFSFDGGTTTAEQIYVINISRARYKQALLPGSLNLSLTSGSGGNTKTIKLTDDSNTTSLTRFIGENKVFYIISGSNGNYCTSCNSGSIYGMMLPDLGVIILDASGSLGGAGYFISASSLETSSVSNNHLRLFTSISASAAAGNPFTLQSQEVVSSRYFFTRVKNSEFNYTTNPSIIDANGNLLYTTLINNPQTYVTTVGMYNDNNELLAVAKLSKPLAKDFTKEALIRIKLDY